MFDSFHGRNAPTVANVSNQSDITKNSIRRGVKWWGAEGSAGSRKPLPVLKPSLRVGLVILDKSFYHLLSLDGHYVIIKD